ncbi:hypothetical protein C0991_010297 [Blastosporella zonata]|nr:hypothetical protein C0991_010297 [Blastosporella zonata]
MLTMFNANLYSTPPPQNRLSASSSQGKLPTDITFIRRRKSTSAKSTKTRSNFFGYSYNAPGDVSGSGHSISGKSSIKSASKRARATPSLPPLPPLSPFPPSNSHKSSTTPQADLRFSTADRTILEELKRNLKAKDAQFVMKGEGSLLGPALGSRGKKHHAFPKEEVPYPRSYGREIMDLYLDDQMIEEDLFFPGKLDNDDESDYTRSERRSSLLSSHRQSSQSHSSNNLESLTDSEPSFLPDDASPLTPTTATFPPTPLRSNSPTAQVAVNEEFEKEEAQDLLSQVMRDFMVPSDEASVINDTLSTATTRGHLQVNAPKDNPIPIKSLSDVRTHPPLQYYFPAVPRGARSTHRKDSDDDVDCEESGSDSDDARDAILPSPVIRVVKRHSRQNREEEEVPISEENGYVSVRSLVEHSSPYITIDESRAPAISPAIKGMFPDTPSAKLQRGYLLPNTTMHLDLKTLNLHLALRAAEIVACSESMWDWVYERKERAGLNRPVVRGHRSGSGSVEMPVRRLNVSRSTRRDTSAPFENDILDLTREEFDGLVNWFEMDMRDKCAISDALGDRFSWNVAKFPVSEEREVFEKACEKWDKWEQEQGQLARTLSQSSHHAYATGHPSPAVLEGSHPTGYPTSGEQRKKRASSILVTSPPQRLSRVMRVFVAWKAG